MCSERTKQRPTLWHRSGWIASILAFSFLIACVQLPCPSDVHDVSPLPRRNEALIVNRDNVLVKCELTTPYDIQNDAAARGILSITVHRGIAPLASNAFLDMVASNHFDHNYIFRVVKGFIVQWGITDHEEGSKKRHFPKLGIDLPSISSISTALRSNVRGALNFAGGDSSSGQVYVNMGTNLHLDEEPGSLPFATLDEHSMSVIDSIYAYEEGLGEVLAVKNGDAEVERLFPRMSRIEKCWVDIK